ncbi:leucine-rich repeat receptor-like protein kinase family protein [Striga asiatica]|uniref:Leucine-rich repeat receptor-like protein kinase family protein n=1 Tax=Striga asiatica TaxID=4170 RepID=A0A5A7PYB2_STRAF|nr:leucine-rich repeat receptor-like protein kinase family protein [Striga asiatica]
MEDKIMADRRAAEIELDARQPFRLTANSSRPRRINDNNLHGPIPRPLAGMSSLKVLDVSNNNLYGTIPTTCPFKHIPLNKISLRTTLGWKVSSCWGLRMLQIAWKTCSLVHLTNIFPPNYSFRKVCSWNECSTMIDEINDFAESTRSLLESVMLRDKQIEIQKVIADSGIVFGFEVNRADEATYIRFDIVSRG